jgi:predicted SAM-dependent methyltransferase
MMLLNLCCGGVRVQDADWINLDNLHAQFPKGPEREQIDKELNYVNHDVLSGPLPLQDASFDGVLLAHSLEHFDARQGLKLVKEIYRVLKPRGIAIISVPDASYFRKVHELDLNANWQELYGVTDPKNPIPTFFEAALWFDEHYAILTEDAVWAYLRRAGFSNGYINRVPKEHLSKETRFLGPEDDHPYCQMINRLDRLEFSLVMAGTKL